MAKKNDDLLDEIKERGERTARRRAKSKLKKLHTATKALAALFLLVGVVIGVCICTFLSKNDRFVLKGQTQISLDAGAPYVYVEEGCTAVCFGMDCSARFKVEASRGITMDENGNYVIPAEEGVYTLTYTVDHPKFNGKLGGEQLKRIRVFTVNAEEEDGRNG